MYFHHVVEPHPSDMSVEHILGVESDNHMEIFCNYQRRAIANRLSGKAPTGMDDCLTKSESEHMVQIFDMNPRQTAVSVDGIGAFDFVLRNACCEGWATFYFTRR